MNVLPGTWVFKCKRYPDGLIKKFKAQFCAQGDKQIEGVDFFETYAPGNPMDYCAIDVDTQSPTQSQIKTRKCDSSLFT